MSVMPATRRSPSGCSTTCNPYDRLILGPHPILATVRTVAGCNLRERLYRRSNASRSVWSRPVSPARVVVRSTRPHADDGTGGEKWGCCSFSSCSSRWRWWQRPAGTSARLPCGDVAGADAGPSSWGSCAVRRWGSSCRSGVADCDCSPRSGEASASAFVGMAPCRCEFRCAVTRDAR